MPREKSTEKPIRKLSTQKPKREIPRLDQKKRPSSSFAQTMRSPALDSFKHEGIKEARGLKRPLPDGARPAPRRNQPAERGSVSQRSRSGRNGVRYAAEGHLLRQPPLRKRLPPLVPRALNSTVSVTGRAIGAPPRIRDQWSGERVEKPENATQMISIEEQKKLATLEMSLPRVAGKFDHLLLIVVLALICIGIVMVYSASAFTAARYYGDASYFFQRELLWIALGLIVMLFMMRIDYRLWRKLSLPGMAIILPLLIVVLKFGTMTYGASRWLSIGSFFSFQPSELTKLVLSLYIADWLARKGQQVGTFLYGLAPFVILVGIVLGLVLLENDMGTAIIIAAFATAMFFSAGANIVQFLLALGCGGLIFLREALKGYRYYRITGFLDPFKDVTGINLQLYQSLLALGSGGWFGLGLGASRQKTGYLPFPFTDSIFPILGEELGFLGCAVVVILFLILAFRGFRLARRTPDIYGSLLATGITTWLIVQAMINIGANTGTIPYTGVPLPFISFGGSSLIISLAGIGVLLNISRYIQEPATPAISRHTISFKKKKLK